MLQEWFREQWENIRYAHKSVWVSMVFFIFLASCIIGYAVNYNYSSQLAEKDAAIANLTAQLAQIQKQPAQTKPQLPSASQRTRREENSNAISDMKEQVQEKINDINNDANVLRYRYR